MLSFVIDAVSLPTTHCCYYYYYYYYYSVFKSSGFKDINHELFLPP